MAEEFGQTDGRASGDASKPNIIFILADDLGYGHLGSYGQMDIETPEFDNLARSGLRYFPKRDKEDAPK